MTGVQTCALPILRREYAAVEQSGGLIGIMSASVNIVGIKAEVQFPVGVDGEIRFEAFFAVLTVEFFVVAQIGKRRFRICKDQVFRMDDTEIVRIGKDELAPIPPIEVDAT